MNRDEPLTLALDCACSALSVALTQGGRVLGEHYEAMTQGQAASLAPRVQEVLRRAAVKPAQIDLLGVTVGPGSFTGIRIGLAFARGLALALDRPLAGRTTFDAVCDALAPIDPPRRLIAAIDSKREELFLRRESDPPVMALPQQAVADWPEDRYGVLGDATAPVMSAFESLGRQGECVVLASAPPRAAAFGIELARQGVAFWQAHNAQHGLPRPLYLRAPDVTMGKHKKLPTT